ncbi:hypothetical protein C2R22_01950 [Salinigranum rubrum]|uniref:Domain of unknown function domain-containing protein n=2 Tax=Salinigranum rubrum TaxID=755307 RepID=A0A2I8VF76_9EURY|nr:hypothetical protein C2R22_01950 [Salinigranum rubrum]
MVDALSFLYKGSIDQNIPFEILVERGVRKAINQEKGAQFGVLNVDLDIEYVNQHNVEGLLERLDAGEEITNREAETVVRYLFRNPGLIDEKYDKSKIVKIITDMVD